MHCSEAECLVGSRPLIPSAGVRGSHLDMMRDAAGLSCAASQRAGLVVGYVGQGLGRCWVGRASLTEAAAVFLPEVMSPPARGRARQMWAPSPRAYRGGTLPEQGGERSPQGGSVYCLAFQPSRGAHWWPVLRENLLWVLAVRAAGSGWGTAPSQSYACFSFFLFFCRNIIGMQAYL